MQMEHHGKAILVFTMVTIIFLPMSFVASVFGMNVADIRNMTGGQWYFWCCALVMTVITVGFSVAIAFLGDEMEKKVRALLRSRGNKS
jgi:Mg2+ and Co2+ transporter CorA